MNIEWFDIVRSIGIWMNGHVSWLKAKEWNVSFQRGSGTAILNAYHKIWHLQVTIVKDLAEVNENSELTLIIKNGTKNTKHVRLIIKKDELNSKSTTVSMVSSFKQSIVTYEQNRVTLLSTSFFQDEHYQLAVGEEEIIWNEHLGTLNLSPIWRGEHIRMATISLSLDGYAERAGRIWFIEGQCEEDLYDEHMNKWLKHQKNPEQRLS
ncbi:hypothetical protein [Bacillus sp. JCM 19034]|uniref:hypothetical protein n=1 Tax=Bacillus sp. JCM 19034 TaxID=1481928 RepID=UPI000785D487|nr:hypothetical protein [Bacillus sp. JCM 19034]